MKKIICINLDRNIIEIIKLHFNINILDHLNQMVVHIVSLVSVECEKQ